MVRQQHKKINLLKLLTILREHMNIQKTLCIASNIFLGNIILFIFVSSSMFFQSLMLNFQSKFHILFSLLSFIFIFAFFKLAPLQKKQTFLHLVIFGFFSTITPLFLTGLIMVGISFIPASLEQGVIYQGIIISFKFGIVGCVMGIFYWLPFGILNAICIRRSHMPNKAERNQTS